MLRKLAIAPLLWVMSACGDPPPPPGAAVSTYGVYVLDEVTEGDQETNSRARLPLIDQAISDTLSRVDRHVGGGDVIHMIHSMGGILVRIRKDIPCAGIHADGCWDPSDDTVPSAPESKFRSISIKDRACDQPWPSSGILAHEFGHAIGHDHDHVPWYGPNYKNKNGSIEAYIYFDTCFPGWEENGIPPQPISRNPEK